jgi:two-component system osmolarity sensor histidine kinase EnvZ
MLAGISHDLRTPLARLRLEAELSVPDQEALQNMGNDIAQVESIITKFMDYARPSGQTTHRVNLGDLLAALLNQPTPNCPVELSLGKLPAPLWVQADEVDLNRVLQNILENAGKYGKTPGSPTARVHISARQEGQWVLVGMSDQGPGVDAPTLSHLTQPFFRADAARSQASGAGLGLAVVEKMLSRMGGSLTLVSPCPAAWQHPADATASGHAPSGLLALIRLRVASADRSPPAA